MQKFPNTKATDQIVSALAEIPQIKRGMVWCTVCGHAQAVDGGGALTAGWPKHCGYTMTIDSPEERADTPDRVSELHKRDPALSLPTPDSEAQTK